MDPIWDNTCHQKAPIPKEWLDASLFDAVKANRSRGLHLSMVRILLRQLLEQLKVLQAPGVRSCRFLLFRELMFHHVSPIGCMMVYVNETR